MSASKQSEVYETPDVDETLDQEEIPTKVVYSDDGPIVSTQFDPTDSFRKFQDAALDSRGKDYSDSIGKPLSVTSRTTFEAVKKPVSDKGDEEDLAETPMQRYERLRAEVTGFLRDIENIRSMRAQSAEASSGIPADELDGVSLVELADRLKSWQSQLQTASKVDAGLDTLVSGHGTTRPVAQSEITTQLLGRIAALKTNMSDETPELDTKGVMAYELVYSKDTAKDLKIARVTELERRLAALEQMVTGKVAPELSDDTTSPKGLLVTIEEIRQKVSSLNERAIDQLSHRMTKLQKQYEALRAAREAHLSASSASASSTSGGSTDASPLALQPEQEAKIESVYNSLSQLEIVASELPIVVDRMVQLRALHEQAVHFSTQLNAISSTQTELSTALQANLAGINRMQESLTSNMAVIEKNVLSLEKRIADVSTLLSK